MSTWLLHGPLLGMMLSVLLAAAMHLIAERRRRGRLAKLRAGTLLPWTYAPYGYRLNPDRPRDPAGVATDPAEAAVGGRAVRHVSRARDLADAARHAP